MSKKKPYPALVMLQERFPAAFTADKNVRPLAVGIKEEIRAAIPAEELPDNKLGMALVNYCNRMTYFRAVVADGARRVHLDGSDAGEVNEEGRRIAGEKLKAAQVIIQANMKAKKAAVKAEAEKQARKAAQKAEQEARQAAKLAAQEARKAAAAQAQAAKKPAPKPKAVQPVVQVKKKRVPERS